MAARKKAAKKAEEEKVWSCPGCPMKWKGPEGSHQWRAWRSHTARHAHARGFHPQHNPTVQPLDQARRDRADLPADTVSGDA